MKAETNNFTAAGGSVGVVKYLENLLLYQLGSLARGGEDLKCERGDGDGGQTVGLCTTQSALCGSRGTLRHHVKLDIEHV